MIKRIMTAAIILTLAGCSAVDVNPRATANSGEIQQSLAKLVDEHEHAKSVNSAVKAIDELKSGLVELKSETQQSNNANNTTQQGINANVNKIAESVKLVDGGLLNIKIDVKATNKIVTDFDATMNVILAPKINSSIEATNNMVAKVEATNKVVAELSLQVKGQAGAFNKMEETVTSLKTAQTAGHDAITKQTQFTKEMGALMSDMSFNLMLVALFAFLVMLLMMAGFFVFVLHLVGKAHNKVIEEKDRVVEEKELSRKRSEERYTTLRSMMKPS